MKTSLPERSLVIKERLDKIVEQILAIRKGKIAMIILRKEDNARGFNLRMEDQIERRLEYKGIEDPLKMDEPLVSLVIEKVCMERMREYERDGI